MSSPQFFAMDAYYELSKVRKLTEKQQGSYTKELYLHVATDKASTELSVSN